MPYIKTKDSTDLYVKDWGSGRPVVLLHGWPLTADSWDDHAYALANAGYRVIAYDRRGFGRSGQPWSGYEYDTLSDDLADVLEEPGATDATIVGFSMGGGEVARYMSRHGGRGVVKAGLISSVVPFLLKTDSNPDGVPEATIESIKDGIKEDRANYLATFLRRGLDQQPCEPGSARLVAWHGDAGRVEADARLRGCLRHHRLPRRSAGDHRADLGHPRHVGQHGADRPHRPCRRCRDRPGRTDRI
jgi:pimeloyl-ACP methyl ester carboxylesterase